MKTNLNRCVNLLLLLLAALSLVFLLVESIGCTVRGSLAEWIAALCVCLWVAASFRGGLLIGMPAAAALLYAAYRRFGEDLSGQLSDLLDRISGTYYTQIYAPGSDYLYEGVSNEQSMIVLLAAFLIAAVLISVLCCRSHRLFLSLLATLPILGFCIAVNAKPSPLPLVCLTAFWALMLVSGDRWDPHGNAGRAVILSAIPVALVLLALLAVRSPANYSYTEKDLEMSRRADEFVSRAADLFIGKSQEAVPTIAETYPVETSPFETESPQISELPPLRLSWEQEQRLALSGGYDFDAMTLPVFRYTSERGGRMYFRVRSFGDYDGSGWLQAEETPGMSSLNFTAKAAASTRSEAYEVEIEMLSEFDGLPLPYYTVWNDAGDSAANGPAGEQLSLRCYAAQAAELSLPRELRAQEEAYRGYAHETYTRLTEDTRAAVLAFCSLRGLSPDDPALIEKLAEAVRSHVPYSLDAVYPEGDAVVYFLTQAESGYCIHYASAAAAICRALGIPARVTTGFVSEASAGRSVTVTAADAHAWVEIYRDGLGWLPLEVTGQSAPSAAETPQSAVESPEALPDETNAPAPVQTLSPRPAPSAQPLPVGWIGEEEAPASLPGWAVFLIASAIFAACFFLRYAILRLAAKRRFAQADSRKAVVSLYRAAKKAVCSESEVPQLLRETAEKAVFSRSGVTREERAAAQETLDTLLREEYLARSPLGKFVFRFWQGLT